jgi:hypothetical protein
MGEGDDADHEKDDDYDSDRLIPPIAGSMKDTVLEGTEAIEELNEGEDQ